MAPELAQFERDYKDKVAIVELNVDQKDTRSYQDFSSFKHSQYIPETQMIVDGKVVYTKVGLMKTADMEKIVDDVKAGKPVKSEEN